jgi:polar amino acid transport system permease protein
VSVVSTLTTPTAGSTRSGLPPTPPAPVTPVACAGLGVAVVAAGSAAMALHAIGGLGSPAVWVRALLVVVGLACALPVVTALQAFVIGARRSRRYAAGDLAGARAAAAAGREKAATAMGWSLSVLVLAGILAFVAANGGAVAHTFLQAAFVKLSWWDVTKSFWVNIQVAVYGEILVLALGLLIAIMRLLPGPSGRPLRWLAMVYVDTFRAIPSVIVLYLVGFGLSLAKVPVIENLSPMWLAIFALTLTYSAYVAEVYRAGIESIHPSQWAASRSLGLSYGMTLRTVIVPQAVRRIVPPLLNDFIGLQKDTALLVVIGVTEAFTQARMIVSDVFNLTPVMVVAALFVIITIPQARFVDRLIEREQRKAGRA